MEIIVYADESGTFDKVHNDYFVFGGVIFLSEEERDQEARKYINVEKSLRETSCKNMKELKANLISNKDKGKIFRSLNGTIRFAVVIRQKAILNEIFNNKKSKQRYLDFAFKIGLKKCLKELIAEGKITPNEVDAVTVYMDEHTTATNGRYELREALEQEFKCGTFNYDYMYFYKPLFGNLEELNLQFCNSAKKPLIRAADIVANKVYYCACNNKIQDIESKVYLTVLP